MLSYRVFASCVIAIILFVGFYPIHQVVLAGEKQNQRMEEAATIFQEIMDAPDKGIPQDLLHDCAALMLIPSVKKGAFIFGAEYGRGIMVVRQKNRNWGSPSFVMLSGGSFGFQIGGQSTDIILVITSHKGIQKLTESKFKLGADASVAAGPVGRTLKANTDAKMQAEILSYSRSQGVFAGVSLEGAVLKLDNDSNKSVYGHKLSGKDAIAGEMPRPSVAGKLYKLLEKFAK